MTTIIFSGWDERKKHFALKVYVLEAEVEDMSDFDELEWLDGS